jgi:SAM-dependent methyltransferase
VTKRHSVDSTRHLYSDGYFDLLADPGESFSRRYAEHYSALVRPAKDDRILELGCASGRTTEVFLESGAGVVAVDFDERACSLTRRRAERFGDAATVICESADALENFDGINKITMLDFVEHVDDDLIRRILDNMRGRTDATLYVFTPNWMHPYEWAQRLHVLAGDPTHINVKTWHKWIGFFEREGMRIVDVVRAPSHPLALARIERPLMKVPVLDRVFVRSVGLAMHFEAGSASAGRRPS